MRKIIVCVLIALMLLLTGCKTAGSSVKATEILFDTVVEIELFDGDEELLEDAVELCEYYHKLFDPDDSESDIYKLNNAGGEAVRVSSDTLAVLEKAIYYSKLSEGMFDITVRPVSVLWDFGNNKGEIPTDSDINSALASVNYNNIIINDNGVQLLNSAQLDFGAIAKGYIADKLREFLYKNGCENALINMGGNLLFLGENEKGEAFSAGVQKPFGKTGEIAAYINNISGLSVVSSGNYMRCFEKDGRVYHHILNPKNGKPIQNELNSVTVICKSSADADCLSTVCFALGLKNGSKLIESIDGAEAVFILQNGEMEYTAGLQKTGGKLPEFTLK